MEKIVYLEISQPGGDLLKCNEYDCWSDAVADANAYEEEGYETVVYTL